MTDSRSVLAGIPKRIGVAADHGGFESKDYLAGMLRKADYEVVDFGNCAAEHRMTTIRILLCPWLVRLLAAKWIEVWRFAVVA